MRALTPPSATQSGTTTESYTYDPVGNRLTSLGVANYTNNTSNELTSTSNATYTFDYNGNTLTKSDSTGTTNYAWDFENRLTSVTLPGSGGTISFAYDPFGRRIKEVTPSTTSIFAYDGDNLVEEINSSGSAVARYSQGLNIDEPLAMLRSGATSFYNADGLGTITSLANTAGSLAQTYTFDSFGKQTASSGSLTNPFQYTARESDTETGLYYYRARYYDASTGRFTTEDPARLAAGVDFYSYVKNNPVIFNDPFGRQPDSCGGTTDCNKYKQLKRYDLYVICQLFPNDPKSNCIRLCLQQNFWAGSHGVGSYSDPPLGAAVTVGGDAAIMLGQAYGPVTHLMCFKKCGLF